MLPALYRLLTRLLGRPLARHLLAKRSRRSPAYLLHQGERFGEPLDNPVQHAIWVHAVSVGETRAAVPLVQALRRRFPDAPPPLGFDVQSQHYAYAVRELTRLGW
ncbi:glycosyltransferase N-terminal domain-containing protein, partial [Eikenella corrodens]|nr:glycosyltransferase N-terminal domain-containing protein [Eikenella corrodens]